MQLDVATSLLQGLEQRVVTDSLLRLLSPHAVNGLVAARSSRRVTAGWRIATPAQTCTELWEVRSGALIVRRVCEQSGELLPVAHLGPGDLYGTHAVHPESTHAHFVHTIGESELFIYPRDSLAALHGDDRRMLERLGTPAVRHWLRRLDWAGLSQAVARELVLDLSPRKVVAGQTLWEAGKEPRWVGVLSRGRLRCGGMTLMPGRTLGLESFVVGAPPFVECSALTDAEVLELSTDRLRLLCSAAPRLREVLQRLVVPAAHPEPRFGHAEPTDHSYMRTEQVADPEVDWELEGTQPKAWQRPEFVGQRDETDCGAACLRVVAAYHGIQVSHAEMRALTRTRSHGTSMWDLARAGEKVGLSARGVRVAWQQLGELDLPAIAHQPARAHFVVLWRVTGQHVVVLDPAFGTRRLSQAEFEASWQGMLLLIRPRLGVAQRKRQIGVAEPSALRTLLTLARPPGRVVAAVLAGSVALQVLGLGLPFATQVVFDRVLTGLNRDLLNVVLCVLLAQSSAVAGLSMARAYLVAVVAARLERDLSEALYERVLASGAALFERFSTSDIVNRFAEIGLVRGFVAESAVNIGVDLLGAVLLSVVLLVYAPLLAGVVLASLPLLVGIVWLTARVVRRYTFAHRIEDDRYRTHLLDALKGHTIVQMHALEGPFASWMRRLLAPALESSAKASLFGTSGASLSYWLQLVTSALVLWVGARQVLASELTVGELAAASMLARNLSQPVLRLAAEWTAWQRMAVSGLRIAGLIHDSAPSATMTMALVRPPGLQGRIEFRGVTFRYGEQERAALEGLDLVLEPGEVVGIVGASGSGKSTLLKLLLASVHPSEGAVFVDDYNLRDVDPRALREQVGYIIQEPHIISGTVLENIAAGRDVTAEAVVSAARAAGAYQFISELPSGFETRIGERGLPLSGGQRQRIHIARALVHRPRLLVLDEATAALDPISEQVLHMRLRELARDCTTLIVTHRISTLRHVDRVLVFEQGRLVEDGSPAELELRRAAYWSLAHASPEWSADGSAAAPR